MLPSYHGTNHLIKSRNFLPRYPENWLKELKSWKYEKIVCKPLFKHRNKKLLQQVQLKYGDKASSGGHPQAPPCGGNQYFPFAT